MIIHIKSKMQPWFMDAMGLIFFSPSHLILSLYGNMLDIAAKFIYKYQKSFGDTKKYG